MAAVVAMTACRRGSNDREHVAPVPSEVRVTPRAHLDATLGDLFVGGAVTCARTGTDHPRVDCAGVGYRSLFGNDDKRGEIAFIAGGATPVFAQSSSCLLFDDFAVRCWSIGGARPWKEWFPSATPTDRHVLQLTVNDRFACALLSDQTVWCWGENAFGQLGDGTTIDREFPTQVSGLHDVREVSAGHGHTCAVKHGGAVWCWGRNEHGQLGDGTTTDAHAPKLTAIGEAVQVACGEAFSCARRGDGSTMCWGSGKYGQNGDATFGDRDVPTVVPIAAATRELALGDEFACARGVDDRVRCWGRSDHGQLGRGLLGGATGVVAEIAPWPAGLDGGKVSMLRAGARHACARLEFPAGSAIACWGSGTHGELGSTRSEDASTPIALNLHN